MSKKQKTIEYNFENTKQGVIMHRLPIYKVTLVKESFQPSPINVVKRPSDVYDIAKQYLQGLDREHFVVLMLDVKNKILGIHTVSIGILSSCPVHPREVFKAAIVVGASSIILLHNHPSGDPTPSTQDISLTKRLMEIGELMGIELLDHLVIGTDGYISMREEKFI